MDELPAWCEPLPDAGQMREIDRWAIERRDVPSLELMERAGEGVAAAVERLRPDGDVAVLCGKGNNGGDGLVAARLLRERGRRVSVISIAGEQELRGDALESLRRLQGEPPLALLDGADAERGRAHAALQRAEVIVDALLGTGFAGAPRGAVAEAIELLGRLSAPVVSVDVPSGVDASTGVIEGAAVRATLTVTFHAAKPGLRVRPGKACAGEVEVADIGIPRGAPQHASAGLVQPSVLQALRRRGGESTKFSSGHVLVVGGSLGLTGAPRMSAEGAMRAGAGYVTACVPGSLQPLLAGGGRPEMMTRPLAECDGALAVEALEQVLDAMGRGGSLVLGAGLGRSSHSVELARALTARAPLPLVLDADGLNAHAQMLPSLAGRRAATVLTPHAGELGRLLGLDSAEIEARRLQHAREAAALAQAVLVLKGDDTLIADPSGRVAISPGGSPALATAGTGDVLSGVIGAFLAQGLDAFAAAAAGVLLHVIAGRIAARDVGCAEGVIASDVIAALPKARAEALG
jgi:ADP-dependent NAD(P)H-hydrate dehydratase / NAD(P)H-hydrate epimerase